MVQELDVEKDRPVEPKPPREVVELEEVEVTRAAVIARVVVQLPPPRPAVAMPAGEMRLTTLLPSARATERPEPVE
jgi:hypothetical protein